MLANKKPIYRKGHGMGNGVPDIFKAAAENDLESLGVALQHHDVNTVDENGMTPLHHSAGHLAFEATQKLLEHPEIDTQCKDHFGREAAIMAEDILGVGNSSADKMRELIWKPTAEDMSLDVEDEASSNSADLFAIRPDAFD